MTLCQGLPGGRFWAGIGRTAFCPRNFLSLLLPFQTFNLARLCHRSSALIRVPPFVPSARIQECAPKAFFFHPGQRTLGEDFLPARLSSFVPLLRISATNVESFCPSAREDRAVVDISFDAAFQFGASPCRDVPTEPSPTRLRFNE